jgi:hypothetical protein
MSSGTDYVVKITYREPTYELRSGAKENPFSASFRIRAESREAAERLALDEFRRQEQASFVSWSRVIEKIECETAAESGGGDEAPKPA